MIASKTSQSLSFFVFVFLVQWQGNDNRFRDYDDCMAQCKVEHHLTEELTYVVAPVDQTSSPIVEEVGPRERQRSAKAEDLVENPASAPEKVEERDDPPAPDNSATPVEQTGVVAVAQEKPVRDKMCLLPKDSGPCNRNHRMYYYDAGKDACLLFIYGGCGVS